MAFSKLVEVTFKSKKYVYAPQRGAITLLSLEKLNCMLSVRDIVPDVDRILKMYLIVFTRGSTGNVIELYVLSFTNLIYAVSIPETQTELKTRAESATVLAKVVEFVLICLKSILIAVEAVTMQSGSLKHEVPKSTTNRKRRIRAITLPGKYTSTVVPTSVP